MGIFNIFKRKEQEPFRVETQEERVLREVGEKKRELERIERKNQIQRQDEMIRMGLRDVQSTGRQVFRDVRGFARQRNDFSDTQYMVSQLFGNGKKIWNLGEESGTKVRINGDLGDGTSETGNLFGFGNKYYPNQHLTARHFGF